jgi:succinate dehydrogenase / fumarate reductase, flavoprotein subunit
MFKLNNRVNDRVPLDRQWEVFKNNCGIISPANKHKHTILVVGSGLAGSSAAATLAELGYNVQVFCLHDSPRRAHSVAAQGGINAAKNYQNDGDSVWRLFYDTLKGGDFRSREANVYRLAEISNQIIDHCVAQGVPLAREYGGYLANRSFGGTLVSRTFYARGQTGQQLLLGAYGALMRQVHLGKVELFPQREMLDLVLVDGKARGVVVRNLVTGEIESYAGAAVILASGGYSNVYYLSTNAKNSNASAAWRCYKRGAGFANPCFTQIHPTCIPVGGDYQSKLTLMSESLRNDGRVWVPKQPGDRRHPRQIPAADRDYFLEQKYPTYGNLVPRDIASRTAKEVCDRGGGVGESGLAVYLDFSDAIAKFGRETIADKYGNLFEMYQKITGDDAYQVPMQIYPAVHYVMGGLWVDYALMSTIPGLFAIGEANFSEHGANRLGASALMQGLADGYFIIPQTIGDYLAKTNLIPTNTNAPEFQASIAQVQSFVEKLLTIGGKKTARTFHRELGTILWEHVGMSRTETSLKTAKEQIGQLQSEFWENLLVPGESATLNKELELAGRVADFLELGELMADDALARNESCGCHFRAEFQTPTGEAQRDDADFSHIAVWEYAGATQPAILHREPLIFNNIQPVQRVYQ